MRPARTAAVLLGWLCVVGCELQEVSIVDVQDAVVAEVYVQVGGDGPLALTSAIAFFHSAVGSDGPPPEVASVRVQKQDGTVFEFGETNRSTCADRVESSAAGPCFWLPPVAAGQLRPGDALELTITLAGGGVLRSATTIPGDFRILGVEDGQTCVLPVDTPLEIRWTRSEGAWAYINETEIYGLEEALAPRGIEVERSPLELIGLSISAADTTVVFPGEFGIFDRFDLDQELAAVLQVGMPPGTSAPVTISSADRNYVNWVRGGNFNPSGPIRVASVVGAGTGVFAATVTRSLVVGVNPGPFGQPYEAPACPVS